MATVTIIYNGPIINDEIRKGASIPRYFAPMNSYVDLPVMTEGFANPDELGDEGTYGRSIYATNVDGFGRFAGLAPMFSNTTPFAMFEKAWLAAKAAEAAGEENEGISFEVEGYKEELYWEQQGRALKDQGFEVTVESEPAPGPTL